LGQPVQSIQTVVEDVFISAVGSQRSATCVTALARK